MKIKTHPVEISEAQLTHCWEKEGHTNVDIRQEGESRMNNMSSGLKNPGKDDKINTKWAGGRKSMTLETKWTKNRKSVRRKLVPLKDQSNF